MTIARKKQPLRGLWTVFWGTALGLVCTGSCAEPEAPAAPRTQVSDKQPRPVRVELATVQTGSLIDGWTFLGRIEPALAAELATAVPGHVLSVKVREGDRVSKNQVLLALDSDQVRAELAAAQARVQGLTTELTLAQRQLARVANLSYPTISEPERERYERDVAQLEAQLAIQRAEVRRVQVTLNRHTLRAPFAGRVSERHVDPGAWVSTGQSVLGLIALDALEIHVDVSAELIPYIKVGQSARLLGPSNLHSTTAEAEIAGIVGALDPETRTMRVRLVIRDASKNGSGTVAENRSGTALTAAPPWLLAGGVVNVEFSVTLQGDDSQASGTVIVSRDALLQGPTATRVVKYERGMGVSVPVEVVATAGTQALVRGAGLAPGDRVVVRGNQRLRPGQPLQVVSGGAASGDAASGGAASGGAASGDAASGGAASGDAASGDNDNAADNAAGNNPATPPRSGE